MARSQTWWKLSPSVSTHNTSTSTAPAGDPKTTAKLWTDPRKWPRKLSCAAWLRFDRCLTWTPACYDLYCVLESCDSVHFNHPDYIYEWKEVPVFMTCAIASLTRYFYCFLPLSASVVLWKSLNWYSRVWGSPVWIRVRASGLLTFNGI